MPKEVKAYACGHGCGRRVQTDRKAVEKHEKTCAKNPERRACKTCKHKRTRFLPSDVADRLESEPICAIQKMPYGVLMHYDCEHWSG